MTKNLLTWALGVLICSALTGQNTIGLLTYDTEQVEEGYNLVFPHTSQDVWLLDNCGRICQFWDGDSYSPGNQVFLDEDGKLYKCIGNGALSNEWFHAGGGGEGIEIRDEDDNILWQYFLSDSLYRFHHDITITPEGTILAIAWERFFEEDCLAAGADPGRLVDGELWSEMILEIEPVGTDEANILWEWHAWDHLIQDNNEDADNFGSIADHPEKIDINYAPDSTADWMHANAIDYNEYLDQIMISIPTFSEVWVIDHSTSTEEAASESGGNASMGGGLLYRWGNPEAYDQGGPEDKVLYYQHHAHWLDLGIEPGHPDFGKMGAFNNRLPGGESEVVIWSGIFDSYEWEYPKTGDVWGPAVADWSYQTEDPALMYSNILSSVQRLENGNTLIGVGRWARGIEINPDGDIVWDYRLPLQQAAPVAQGTELPINANLLWRINRYPSDYSGLSGMDLTPMGYIELDPDDSVCPLNTSVEEINLDLDVQAFPNPTTDVLNVSFGQAPQDEVVVSIYDASGRLIDMQRMPPAAQLQLSVSDLSVGMYTVVLQAQGWGRTSLSFSRK